MTSDDLITLIDENTSIKVSSTLEKATGKKHLVDNSPETCWTSQQGLPQFIQLGFSDKPIVPKRLSMTFQGGFVGTRCVVQIPPLDGAKDWQVLTNIYPEDVNRRQVFDLKPIGAVDLERGVTGLRLLFEESSDFFGRITVYDLKIEGTICLSQKPQ